MLERLRIHRPKTMRQQIRDELRAAIVSGRLAPGTSLPSTRELAAKWGSPPANVHAALSTLVKEGLLVREPGIGTVVNRPEKRLARVALYSMASAIMRPEAAFEQAVLSGVGAEYSRRGIEVEALVDPRPSFEQGEALPFLVDAAYHRRVQAVVSARVAPENLRWLQKLPVVGAFVSSFALGNTIVIDDCQFIRESLRVLRAQSVGRVGLIVPWTALAADRISDFARQKNPVKAFLKDVSELGLETRPEWIKVAESKVPDDRYEWFGHRAFKALWRESRHPDGLVVFTDFVAHGVLHGILEAGVRVPGELRLALHRNAELPYYCPVPATFVEMSIQRIVHDLIDLVDRQFRGESVQGLTASFSVDDRWREAIPEPA